MTELRITKGADLELYINGKQLFGVTCFKAESLIKKHDIREYLSSQAYDTLSAGESHKIELIVLSLFGGGVFTSKELELKVVDGDAEYIYEDCALVGFERDAHADKNVCDKYILTAKRMTKRGNENA